MSPDDREGLPFLPGNSALIERIAIGHHVAVNDPDPLVALLPPQGRGELTWFDLLTVGRKTLERVSFEIAAAETEAEAASATLRRDTCLAGLERIEQAMLQTAVRLLSIEALYGYGRQTVGGELKPIPRAHWEAGDVDWLSHRLVVGDKRWYGVKVLDTADLSSKAAAAVADDFGVTSKKAPVSEADLRAFLVNHTKERQPGDPGLTEAEMWKAAKAYFPHHMVGRASVRTWMRNEMDPAKRVGEGRPALH